MVCGGMTTRAMANVQPRPTMASMPLEMDFDHTDQDELELNVQHAVFYCECEDPACAPFTDDADSIEIRFAEELSLLKMAPHSFRLPSKSLGEHVPVASVRSQLQQQMSSLSCKARRTCSEGSLALVPSVADASGCPCEMVQGIHSHQSCPRMDLAIPETSCFTCGSDWLLDHTALACFECGGWGLARPCGKCHGKCGQNWHRDLKLTHASGEATWAGKCSLEKDKPQ
ncbi:uncharacterized protein LOC129589187 [Paramacrobiotus metropolitanus]|uniref:uncharacterized protein LOC129589187 n=1 Tax=Paramacrobiotus metropolitanus TaxID=2943436 RepID=UPI00244569E5|nr:uncharacterized protein LOC129589187 [Paramacrobiotus metropolitanus]XP_055339733.1 uncharacterized protein LOC129589187 [Paramacrobiotus metropolitanus]